jgi:hypothetical protein
MPYRMETYDKPGHQSVWQRVRQPSATSRNEQEQTARFGREASGSFLRNVGNSR